MPTSKEREYYAMGFRDGGKQALGGRRWADDEEEDYPSLGSQRAISYFKAKKPKRKLSPWNKFVKANSKKPRFILRSGKLNLKKMGVAFRKTPAGKKKRR